MTDSRPGGGRVPGMQNNPSRPGQQRAPCDENQYVGRVSPNPNDDVTNNLWIAIDKNMKLQNSLNQLTEMCKRKLKESNLKVCTLSEDNKKLETQLDKLRMQLDECEVKLVDAVQNYENAKVVVLTYKTRNIHLEIAAKELEIKSAELEELKKKISDVERANIMKSAESRENLRYAEEKAGKAQQVVNELQQTLLARSQELDKLNLVVQNIAEQFQISSDQLRWMMEEAQKQQQQSQQSLMQQCDQLNATIHEKDMLISQLDHELNELRNRKSEAETYIRIKGKNMSTEKIETLAAKLDNAQMCIDQMNQEIEGYKREIQFKGEELKRKETAVKGLQDILKKEQQSHQEKLEDYSAQSQQKIHELSEINKKLHDKAGELSEKVEHAETEYAILKSIDLNSHEELQKYKEKVISLEQEIRRGKQTETDLYKELDEALKDLENVSNRYKSLQNENSELKLGHSTPVYSDVNDSQLVQELNHKTKQVEILHGQIKSYADSLDREKRKVAILTMENQHYQQQLQSIPTLSQGVPPVPPRTPAHHNKTQPMLSAHRPWEDPMQPPNIVLSRDTGSSQLMPERRSIEPNYYPESYSQRYKQYDSNAARAGYPQFTVPNSHPQDRSRTIPHFRSEPHSEAGPLDPCPLCGKTFATAELLTVHAASCNS